MTTNFKIYVANLAKYNEGILKGEWLELPMDTDDLQEALDGILGEDEEYAVHDYDNDLGYKVGEYDSVWELNDLAERLETNVDFTTVIEAYLECMDNDIDEALECVEGWNYSIYHGCDNETDLGYYIVDEGLFGVDIPEELKNYIDYEAIGRDFLIETIGCFMDGDYISFY